MSESDTDVTGEPSSDSIDSYDQTLHEDSGLSIHLEVLESGELSVRIYERDEDDGRRQYFTSKEKRDFYTKRQPRRTVANAAAEGASIHTETAKELLLEFFNDLAEADAESEEQFQHPTVNKLIDGTSSVEVYGGETTTVEVYLTWEGETRALKFTDGEWTSTSVHTFKQKFFNAFFVTPQVEKQDWLVLRDHWEAEQEVMMVEEQTTAEIIAESVVGTLAGRVDAYEDRSKLRDDDKMVWYDVDNSAGRSEVPGNEDVVWVRSSAVRTALDELGKETSYMSTLSRALRQEEYTYDSSAPISVGTDEDGDRWQTNCYPFDPDALGLDPELSIIDADTDEDDDDEDDGDGGSDSDGSDGDDGGDDGRPSDAEGKTVVPDGGPNCGPATHREDDIRAAGRQAERKLHRQVDARCPTCGWNPDLDEQPRGECARCEYVYDLGEWQPEFATDGGRETIVRKLNGAPGAGKTHTLFEYVVEERDENDRGASDVMFCTFTRAGRKEAEAEMLDAFPTVEEDRVKKRAKTVHGAALSAALQNDGLEMPPDSNALGDVIIYDMQQDADVYRDFCEQEGISFTAEETNPLKMVREGQDLDTAGNRLFAVYHWLKLERKPLRAFAEAPTNVPVDDRRTLDLLEAWETFKQEFYESPRYEHVDYVDLCIDEGYVPDTRVLFIDEFQDLSPQEYLLYKTWRDSGWLDTIYIAGDKNQSLYSFRAGTPWYFRETPVDHEEYVTESYRCPEAVVDVARSALDACPATDPQGFSAKFDDGTADCQSLSDGEELAAAVSDRLEDAETGGDASVYLLARTNYQVGCIGTALKQHGIPFTGLSSRMAPWSEEVRKAYGVLVALQSGTLVPRTALNTILATHVPGAKQRRQNLGILDGSANADYYRAESVWRAFPDCESVYDVVSLLDFSEYERELMAAALDTDIESLPSDVKVGTIHTAKGSEAPHVFLFNAASKRIHDEYTSGRTRAEEHRITYVGATRASQRLTIVEDFFQSRYTLAGLDVDETDGRDDGRGEEVVA